MTLSITVVLCSVLNVGAAVALARGWSAPTRRWAALVAALAALGCCAAGGIGWAAGQVSAYEAVATADPAEKARMLSLGLAAAMRVALVGLVGMVFPAGATLALLIAPRASAAGEPGEPRP